MLTSWAQKTSCLDACTAAAHSLPPWVTHLFDGATLHPAEVEGGATLTTTRRGPFVLLQLSHPQAHYLYDLEFQRAAALAYRAIRDQLKALRVHPLRFWNIIPKIRTLAPDGLDRYMVFNAGRFAAYTDWYGDTAAFDGAIATATGIGYDSDDLHIHVLAASEPGIPIENPRQRRAYRYSPRYGPMPPCFSRAMISPDLDNRLPSVIVGGTSSVVGEESLHVQDAAAQTTETLRNIAALLDAATRAPSENSTPRNPLSKLDTLRIYLVNLEDADTVLSVLAAEQVSPRTPIEIVRADICRPELLVEIEGTACFLNEDETRA